MDPSGYIIKYKASPSELSLEICGLSGVSEEAVRASGTDRSHNTASGSDSVGQGRSPALACRHCVLSVLHSDSSSQEHTQHIWGDPLVSHKQHARPWRAGVAEVGGLPLGSSLARHPRSHSCYQAATQACCIEQPLSRLHQASVFSAAWWFLPPPNCPRTSSEGSLLIWNGVEKKSKAYASGGTSVCHRCSKRKSISQCHFFFFPNK